MAGRHLPITALLTKRCCCLLKVLLLDVQALQMLFQDILKLVCLPLLHGMWSAHAAELLKNETVLFFHKQDKVSLVSSNNLLLFVCVLEGPCLALPAQCFAPGFWLAPASVVQG